MFSYDPLTTDSKPPRPFAVRDEYVFQSEAKLDPRDLPNVRQNANDQMAAPICNDNMHPQRRRSDRQLLSLGGL